MEDGQWLRTIRTIKINDQSIHMKMYEMRSIYEICRSVCQTNGHNRALAARTYAKVVWPRLRLSHTLILPSLPAHLSSPCNIQGCASTLTSIIATICYECIFLRFFLVLHKETSSDTMEFDLMSTSVPRRQIRNRNEQILIYRLWILYRTNDRSVPEGWMQCNLRLSSRTKFE